MSVPREETRSDHVVGELQARRGAVWKLVRWIHRRRPLLTALVVLVAPLHTLLSPARPLDLLALPLSARASAAWLLMLFGAAVRLWGSGNLRKNLEITDTGIYGIVRHPLYLGSLCFFLAYFLTLGDPLVGVLLFGVLLGGVYYPTMLAEEEYLALKYPGRFAEYDPPPRLLPDPRKLRQAMRSDRFGGEAAYRNLGFRSLWFLVGLPSLLRLLLWIDGPR